MPKKIEMVGRKFGSCQVIEDVTTDSRDRKFIVVCDLCGDSKAMLGGNIRRASRASTSGCRCTPPTNVLLHFRKSHGLSGHPAYGMWEGMIRRCYSLKHFAYHRYGGRGIKVCDEWRESPAIFIPWAELHGWRNDLQMDRLNNDGDYSPGNVRFVTARENANNKCTNRMMNIGGRSLTVSEAAREHKIGASTVESG